MFGLIGSFLGNNELDRYQLQLSSKTVSLWSHLNRPEVLRSFLNPLYEPNNRVIWPSVAPMSVVNSTFFKILIQVFPPKNVYFLIQLIIELVASDVSCLRGGTQHL